MEYAAQLLNPRSVLVPALALVIGAGGALGISSALDDADVDVQAPRVVVTESPAKPGEGVSAKHESATAAAIAIPGPSSSFEGKDEAASAAAIASPGPSSSFEGKDEAASAAAIATSSPRTWLESKDESKTAAAVGTDESRRGGGPPAEDGTANRTDPHGPAAALP
jgi:hypothetical protein